MKRLNASFFLSVALAALLSATPTYAQWQVPSNSVPVGRGTGTGFNSAAPGAAGQVLTSNGASADPSFKSLPNLDTRINVRAYGALGNSNGTHGNGNDDTAAIQAAINAAAAQKNAQNQTGGVVYLPCGTYRITASLSGANPDTSYHFKGDGACSQIYNDSSAPASTLVFNPPTNSGCCVAPGFSIEDVYFIRPYNPNVSAYAIQLANLSNPVFRNLTINGYGRGISLQASYGPKILSSVFSNFQGTALNCTLDESCNNANIWGNSIYFVGNDISEASLKIGPGAASCLQNANNVSLIGNNIEKSYSGPQFNGVCGATLQDSYISENTTHPFLFTSSLNRAIKITGNYFALSVAGGGTLPLSNVTGVDFGPNYWFNQSLSYGANLASIGWSGYQNLANGATLAGYCSETTNCSYMGNGWLRQWGYTTTSGNTAAVTFPIPCPNQGPSEVNTTSGSGSNMTTWYSATTKTGMSVWTSASTGAVAWSITCK